MRKKKALIMLASFTCLAFSVAPAYAAPTGVTQMYLSSASGPLSHYSDLYGDAFYNRLELVHTVIKDNNYASPLFKQPYAGENVMNLSSGVHSHVWDSNSNYKAEGSFKAIQNGLEVWSDTDYDYDL